ncbi:DUF4761 family protein [Hafnia alvei]|uniref:DUF4761 family protein n=1 Tax=Hafnia alvei TaxID=569 RepID=UPI000B70E80E|nr:DUF4761 family protein [Hafnia alvei]MBI0278508.1 DUF4761 family protein [Hafnia alvei]PNK97581.1 DUF4761 domain-containing protein [Hafnia alvei]
MSELVQLSQHTYIYRGFTINKCPRNAITMKTAYNVSQNGQYCGRDFALAEAMKTVDSMIEQRKPQ